jgi:hypothetical protein
MWVGASETVSKPGTTFGVGVGIGIGIGLYERHSKQGLIFFDHDTDSDPDVRCASSATYEFG